MYSPPTDPLVEKRLTAAQQEAARALGVEVSGPRRWGHGGRTLGQAAHHSTHGPCWLRLVSAPQAGGKLWEGTEAAAKTLSDVNMPALYGVHDLTDGTAAYRAELTQFVPSPVCSSDPVLRDELDLPDTWWSALRTDLAVIAATQTDRVAVRQQWIDRAVPQFAGMPAPEAISWDTAHGDLHFANVTVDGPVLLDLEGHGLAPVGYDAATLYLYALLAPRTAAQVWEEFPVLATPDGHTALLVVAADLLQAASRGDHPDLAAAIRGYLRTCPTGPMS